MSPSELLNQAIENYEKLVGRALGAVSKSVLAALSVDPTQPSVVVPAATEAEPFRYFDACVVERILAEYRKRGFEIRYEIKGRVEGLGYDVPRFVVSGWGSVSSNGPYR